MYDVIVVGARCAGSPVAMLLARRGHRVLLVDRVSFPSDTISTHYLQQAALLRLREWGLLDALTATNCRPITDMTVSHLGVVIRGFADPVDGLAFSMAPRRIVLDKLLLDGAVAAGVEVREGFSVRDLIRHDDGTVAGIVGRDATGAVVEERATLVVGADGRNSVVADLVGADFYKVVPAASFIYYSYFSGLDWQFHSRFGDHEQCAGWPTHDGLTLVTAMRNLEDFEEFRADIDGSLRRTFRSVAPELAEDLDSHGVQEDRYYGIRYPDNYYRTSYGPGWALTGDAGYHKDPVTGLGITDAFRCADLLTEHVDQALRGDRPMDEALAEYQRLRDEESAGAFNFTTTLGELNFPPHLVALWRALPNNETARAQFFGMIAGVVPSSVFLAPENVESIMLAAAAV
ncbi:flavin-dependent dehydrogenase [Frankia casuarinae]|jgi:flavin-dependent dehydrogenase|uniref:Monooxygenase, FAD-binding n=2 Tax=Frankia casuarinae (strain DSM 45818 / CECT 9043 / HFP020203 / CcI3) TaxID=106370 RepID=Q2J8V0_FRACC|nr:MULTISPECIES: NAD(P)/FAD-dependent oxidoreductase [Frankia]ABD12292.1 monooxygenase, FAD-binding [Frankia casuarinae]ETA01122.1 flavin-dependent dehydrogenase [Frankia sp. CcI6]EYT90042.1 flavin-dependent dehydrogenase [Frankia casuarinae]KDA42166.1 flavin-dependent dehydrogenase [Frankia sp. BMG5.23]TFE26748.1 NAD(P)/FAD-dependent oxidoreductase [Frankia sp. B2]